MHHNVCVRSGQHEIAGQTQTQTQTQAQTGAEYSWTRCSPQAVGQLACCALCSKKILATACLCVILQQNTKM